MSFIFDVRVVSIPPYLDSKRALKLIGSFGVDEKEEEGEGADYYDC